MQHTDFKASTPACPYCGTTHGLRIASQDPWGGHKEYICAECFTGTDTGPCFDDLPLPELRAIDCTTTKQWEQWARERREYDDPCGQNRSRY